jgi:hypothetical protein
MRGMRGVVIEGIMPRTPIVKIRIRRSDFAAYPFAYQFTDEDGLPTAEIRCAVFKFFGLSID